MSKVIQSFEVPGYPLFEAGKEYDIIPNEKEMIERGLVAQTEKMVEKTKPDNIKDDKQSDKNSIKRVAK